MAELDQNYNGLCYWKGGDLFVFNPIRDPAEAWPIIIENKISIEHAIIKWWAASLVYDKKYESGFFIFRSESDVGDISSRGALRAAMIVFLMMQEKSNER